MEKESNEIGKAFERLSTLSRSYVEAECENKKTPPENLMIPKHRFDCVNLALKGTKERLREKMLECETDKLVIAGLEKSLIDSKVETALAQHKARSLTAVKSLIDFTNLKLESSGVVPGLEEQILRIKKSQSYLFENQKNLSYVLTPVDTDDALNKSITKYVKKAGELKNEYFSRHSRFADKRRYTY